MDAYNKPASEKTYASPQLNKLTCEKARLFLQGKVDQRNQEAKDLWDLLFLPPK